MKIFDLDSRLSVLGLSPGRDHCVVFLNKMLYFHIASLNPGVQLGTVELLQKTYQTPAIAGKL